jgi:hypothetical protein
MCRCMNTREFFRASVFLLLLSGPAIVACQPAQEPSLPAVESGSGAATGASPGAGSGEAGVPPSDRSVEGSATRDADGSSSAGSEGSSNPVIEVPSLDSLMRRAGFGGAGQVRPDEFVPVPPGATAEAGSFDNAERSVRAVLVRYPNPRYARPHVTDVLERRRLLPQSGDAVLSRGAVVIQLQAATRESADALAAELQRLLEWPESTDIQLIE